MSLQEAQNRFIDILRNIREDEDKNNFLRWIHKNWDLNHLPDSDLATREILDSIATELRSRISFDAVLPSERIQLPICGPNADCDVNTTVHVDEFLYNDNHIDDLVEKGRLYRYYCGDCNSKNVKLYTFISHSMSINRLKYIFKHLLPPIRKGMILDVGSRLGAVLYGAYLYTTCPSIVGVEINPEFCKLQYSVLNKYMFGDRIRIVCNNIFNEMELLRTADVIVLNNVFEFFCDLQTTIESWHLLAQNIKPGCILVTVPHLETTFEHVKVNFFWDEWVEPLRPGQRENLNFSENELQSHIENVKHYRVKKRVNISNRPIP